MNQIVKYKLTREQESNNKKCIKLFIFVLDFSIKV